VPEQLTRVAALQSGQVQGADLIPSQNIAQFKADPDFQFLQKEMLDTTYALALNIAKAPWDDFDIRNAVRLSLNIDAIVRIIYGARQSILVAFGAILLGTTCGTVLGLVSGYAGGRVDAVSMRLVDVWMSIPPMLLALIVAAALGGGFSSTVIAIASMLVPRFARVIRARVIGIKILPFIAAARAMGASRLWILWRHVLPHTGSVILVLATVGVAEAIIIGASLSFIWLGVNPDQPDWGYILSEGRNYLTDAWWYATFPGLAITLLVVSVNLLGDALRTRTDQGQGQR
jgi:peptide/nickel transport system permease protein